LKYAVVILVVLLGVWLWRKNRRDDPNQVRRGDAGVPKDKPSVASPQIMLNCAACGVHFPQSDSIAGRRGNYCSLAHRLKQEG
jgi:uncharacterized protein